MKKKLAFTLAEVLITLAIIGVVAALTIPALLSNTNEKGLNTSDSVFQRRLGEALKVMNLQGTLAGQPSTQAFVDELGKHIKIMKTCSSSELSNCFVSEFTDGDKTIKVVDLQNAKNLYKTTDYGTETIGVVFGNGTRALIAYNPKATQDQFNNSNEAGSPVILKTSGTGKQTLVSLETDSLSILYNLQERKDNNVHGQNIRDINVAFKILKPCIRTTLGSCVADIGTPIPIDCTDPINKTYCDSCFKWTNDYWAGARKTCIEEYGLDLPTKIDLVALYNSDNWEGKPTSDSFLSIDSSGCNAYRVRFSNGSTYNDYRSDSGKSGNGGKALCVGN